MMIKLFPFEKLDPCKCGSTGIVLMDVSSTLKPYLRNELKCIACGLESEQVAQGDDDELVKVWNKEDE